MPDTQNYKGLDVFALNFVGPPGSAHGRALGAIIMSWIAYSAIESARGALADALRATGRSEEADQLYRDPGVPSN